MKWTQDQKTGAKQYLTARYYSQCAKHPRTSDIPLSTYISANMESALMNINCPQTIDEIDPTPNCHACYQDNCNCNFD